MDLSVLLYIPLLYLIVITIFNFKIIINKLLYILNCILYYIYIAFRFSSILSGLHHSFNILTVNLILKYWDLDRWGLMRTKVFDHFHTFICRFFFYTTFPLIYFSLIILGWLSKITLVVVCYSYYIVYNYNNLNFLDLFKGFFSIKLLKTFLVNFIKNFLISFALIIFYSLIYHYLG